GSDLTLAGIAERMESMGESRPIDQDWLRRMTGLIAKLKDLKWRYEEGPSGAGRVNLAITNSTGCSSVWGSTYPYNPYPYPWVNHLFQDAPSVAIGVFEGHMRKMADAFTAVRLAELRLADAYDPAEHDPFFEAFDWRQFTDEEFGLCPPILAIGGDGAMLDIGFQNLSRLLASGKPIRVMVLDTQVYSNTGGQACTSGFTGQISDMAAYGRAQHGKQEIRKELALIAMAHRGAYVLQSSQALPSHLMAGVLKGLQSRHPAVFNIYTPCPVEHGLADDWSPHAAKLALESRAFPLLVFDPDGGPSFADCIDLTGNPDPDRPWPTYELEYIDDDGERATMELPLTIADWAVTEGRFKKQFTRMPREAWDDDMVAFHEFVDMPDAEREGKTPFIWAIDDDERLTRWSVGLEIVTLAEDRLVLWQQIKEMAGVQPSDAAHDAVERELEAEWREKLAALEAEHEAKVAELVASLPPLVARRMAEGLLRSGNGKRTVEELLEQANAMPELETITLDQVGSGPAISPGPAAGGATAPAEAPAARAPAEAPVEAEPAVGVAEPAAEEEAAEAEVEEERLVLEPYIETELCTTCDECTNLNNRMFAYDENKQAYIKDPKAGTFRELVLAAEKCTARIIHPGTPLDPNEKDLEKWLARAEPFN
ncbi:MAG: thiamine pyrophosphate-dependent enzyme, partial [Gemmatimonadota bacterium]|nr:thiamine pyrophosphate-dependent enzyme [Gemmatimonadota bacterium]